MTLDFGLVFSIDRVNDVYQLLFTDQTTYTISGVVKGFYRVEYPDGLIVENTDTNNPDFTDIDETTTVNLRLNNKYKPIVGTYIITQKIYIDGSPYSLERNISMTFVEPSVVAINNSSVVVPSVSFLDSTDYGVLGYTSIKTRLFSSFFPITSDLDGIGKTTSTTELIMVDSGNYYEGIYLPKINIDSTYTGSNHEVHWLIEKSFSFDVRKFVGYSELISVINNYKESIKNPKDEQTYQMIMSLYSHLIAKINSGDTDIQDLVSEILELATGSCGCGTYTYQSGPIVVDDIPGSESAPPFIDEVIYREWTDQIIFKSTSTVFHRVSGKIRWFKSKQNSNQGNPIFIDGILNDIWWEEIFSGVTFGDSECLIRTKFTYSGGDKIFNLPYDPEGIFSFHVDGVLQDADLVSFSGSQVTFTGVITSGQRVDIVSTGCDYNIVDFDTNDLLRKDNFTYFNTNSFTLSQTPQEIIMVFVNGKLIDAEDYNLVGDEITINEELSLDPEADRINVYYTVLKSAFLDYINDLIANLPNQHSELILDDGTNPHNTNATDVGLAPLDEEDLTLSSGFIKLKDYESATEAKSRAILRMSSSLADLSSKLAVGDEKIFKVRYEHDLENGTLGIQKHPIIDFSEGGYFKNGTLTSAIGNGIIVKNFRGGNVTFGSSNQRAITISIDPTLFYEDADYSSYASATRLNLSSVMDKIYGAINPPTGGRLRYRVVFPEIMGGATFYLTKPLEIKEGVILEINNTIYVGSQFTPAVGSNFTCVFHYEYVTAPQFVGVIKNVNVTFDNTLTAPNTPFCIFDFTHFDGTLENFTANTSLDIFGILQPFGTANTGTEAGSSFSDMKRLQRVRIGTGKNIAVPSDILQRGDGCIIENCTFNHLMVHRGRSYKITGCLNTSFSFLNSTADLTASYWEIGTINSYGSRLKFDCSRISIDGRDFTTGFLRVDTDDLRADMLSWLVDVKMVTQPDEDTQFATKSSIDLGANSFVHLNFLHYLSQYSANTIEAKYPESIVGFKNLLSSQAFKDFYPFNFSNYPLLNGVLNDVNYKSVDYNTSLVFEAVNSDANIATYVSNGYITSDAFIYSPLTIDIDIYLVLSESRMLYSSVQTISSHLLENGKYLEVETTTNIDQTTVDDWKWAIILDGFEGGNKLAYLHSGPAVDSSRINIFDETFTDNTTGNATYKILEVANIYKYRQGLYDDDSTKVTALQAGNFNECTKIDLINEANIRAYLSTAPTFGTWLNGDEYVVAGDGVYTYFEGTWYLKINLT